MSEQSTQPARMFFQEVLCIVDGQARIVFPKAWRLPTDTPDTAFILTPGVDQSIAVYSEPGFYEFLARANAAPKTPMCQNWLSIFSSLCQRITLDKQGRFVLTEKLRKFANITDKAICVGAMTYGRLMNPDHWDAIRYNNNPPPEPTEDEVATMTNPQREMYNINQALKFLSSVNSN